MKNKHILHIVFYCLLAAPLLSQSSIEQQTSINTDGALPDASAILDVQATDKGMLVPRMTTSQRMAIASPAAGLLVFDTSFNGFWFYNGTAWTQITGTFYTSGTGINIAGNVITNTGDTNPADDITTSTPAGGDLSGNYPNPDIAAGAVGTAELAADAVSSAKILDGTITAADLSNMGAAPGQVMQWNGTAWVPVPGTPNKIQDADGNKKIETEKNPNENLVRITLNGSEKVVFRPNRIELLNNGGSNAFVGENTGAANTGFANTGFGHKAMESNTSGFANTGLGEFAMRFGTTGSYNTGVGGQVLYNNNGERNTAIGQAALGSNTSGSRNSAVGEAALISNTTGNDNVGIGKDAGKANTTGSSNTFVGKEAGSSNTTASNNTFVGSLSGRKNTTGTNNSFIGNEAGRENTTASGNVFAGYLAGNLNTTGASNTFVGSQAGMKNTTASNNVFVGTSAGIENTTGTTNTFVGSLAGNKNTTGASNSYFGKDAGKENTTGSGNTYIGGQAGSFVSTASNNTFVGNWAGRQTSTGELNVFVGAGAGTANTTGGGNTYIGESSGAVNTTGFSNTFLGRWAGLNNTTANSNTIIGAYAGWHITTGINNTIVGADAGDNGVTGSGNVFLGKSAGSAETSSNKLYIDNTGTTTPLIWGDFSVDRVGINRVATTNTLEVGGEASKASAGDWLANSDARLKKNIQPLNAAETLDKLLQLQGITYEWNDDKTGTNRPEGVQFGFTAQNIQEVFPTLVKEDALGYLQTAYGTYDAMMVEAMRALVTRLEQLERENLSLKTQLGNIPAELNQMKADLRALSEMVAPASTAKR